jgi:hypothetical protein
MTMAHILRSARYPLATLNKLITVYIPSRIFCLFVRHRPLKLRGAMTHVDFSVGVCH